MDGDKNIHDVFTINPVELLSHTDHFVKVSLQNGEVISGTVYTIDPVSQSVILVKREKCGELSLTVVLRHSIVAIEKEDNVPEDQKNVLENIITNNKISFSSENMKEDVKNWLLKNMIPVVENGEVLQVDSLKIYPPYGVEQCYSDNSIVLSRIQDLLVQMPPKSG